MRKIQTTEKRTFVELMVGVTVVALALITLLTMFTPHRRHRISATHVSSVNNLKQVFYAPSNGAIGKDVRTLSPDR